jgi:very-short-patch-repair endonuclease
MGRPTHASIAAKRAKALRSHLTISEARLWNAIKGRSVGARFRRQVPIGFWIADFASLNPRLVIEVDDTSHEFRDESMRTDYFESQGFAVLRVTNQRVALELPEVVGTIESWIEHIRTFGEAPE